MMHVAPCLQCSAHANTRTHVHAHNQRAPSISTCTYVKRAKLAARACGKPFVLHHHAAAPPLQQQGSVSISCAPADMHTRAAAFAPDDRARRSRPTIAPMTPVRVGRASSAQRLDARSVGTGLAHLVRTRACLRAMQHRACICAPCSTAPTQTTCRPAAGSSLKLPPLLRSREGPCRCP
jgi:hypothetical protein